MIYSKIKNYLEREKIQVDELAEKTGIGRTTIYAWFRTQTGLKVAELEKISFALNVSPCYWWENDSENKNSVNQIKEQKVMYGKITLEHHKEVVQSKQDEISRMENEIERLEKIIEKILNIDLKQSAS